MAEIDDMHPNLLTDRSIFTLNIGHQNLLVSVNLIGLRHNFSLICYFPQIISILEKIYPSVPNRMLAFDLFMTN